MPCRFTSSTKPPSPCRSRLSSLRRTLWPPQPFCTSTFSGAIVVSVELLAPTSAKPTPPPLDAPSSLRICHRLHGLEDVPVPGAAADVALQRLLDLVLGRARVLAQQRGRTHEHPGRAVAALESVMLVEGLLQRRQLLALAEPFDGLDARAVRLDGEKHAALDERAVEDHRARAAVASVTADVAA